METFLLRVCQLNVWTFNWLISIFLLFFKSFLSQGAVQLSSLQFDVVYNEKL